MKTYSDVELFAEYTNIKMRNKSFLVIMHTTGAKVDGLVTFGSDADKLKSVIEDCEYKKINGLSVSKTNMRLSDVLPKLINNGNRVVICDI